MFRIDGEIIENGEFVKLTFTDIAQTAADSIITLGGYGVSAGPLCRKGHIKNDIATQQLEGGLAGRRIKVIQQFEQTGKNAAHQIIGTFSMQIKKKK